MFDLSGRVAILTGGAGMLGRQYTRTLLSAGAKVVVADANAEQAAGAAKAAVAEAGGEAIGWGVDVRDKAEVDAWSRPSCKRFGRIDILINNAAIDPKLDAAVAGKADQHVRGLSARTVAAIARRQPDRRVSCAARRSAG